MRNLYQMGTLILLIAFSIFGCAGDRTILRRESGEWAKIEIEGNYVVLNNLWNKGNSQGQSQSIFEAQENGQREFGWDWSWPMSNNVVAYPEVIYGDKPWDQPLNRVTQLPFLAGSKKLIIDYDISIQASGVYNLAFELWPVSTVPANRENIKSEIMIWVYNQGMTPAGEKIGALESGGKTFDVWFKKDHGDVSGANKNKWDYIAFAAREPILKGPLDLTPLIQYLIDHNIIQKEHFITSVELGNEIVHGSGTTRIKKYRITIE